MNWCAIKSMAKQSGKFIFKSAIWIWCGVGVFKIFKIVAGIFFTNQYGRIDWSEAFLCLMDFSLTAIMLLGLSAVLVDWYKTEKKKCEEYEKHPDRGNKGKRRV